MVWHHLVATESDQTHTQEQGLLRGLGLAMGYRVCVANSDEGTVSALRPGAVMSAVPYNPGHSAPSGFGSEKRTFSVRLSLIIGSMNSTCAILVIPPELQLGDLPCADPVHGGDRHIGNRPHIGMHARFVWTDNNQHCTRGVD